MGRLHCHSRCRGRGPFDAFRGWGHYDRFLTELRAGASGRVTALAVCLREQIVDEVPNGPRDQKVDGLVTEEETILPILPRP